MSWSLNICRYVCSRLLQVQLVRALINPVFTVHSMRINFYSLKLQRYDCNLFSKVQRKSKTINQTRHITQAIKEAKNFRKFFGNSWEVQSVNNYVREKLVRDNFVR